MSIRFGWTRPQAGPQSTDEEQVEDVSSVPSHLAAHNPPAAPGRTDAPEKNYENVPGGDGPGEAGRSIHTPTGAAVTQPTPEAVQAIWDLHARVIETEKKTHKRIGAAAARRMYHETLVEEAAALSSLGFDSFASFEDAHGDGAPAAQTAPLTPEPPAPFAPFGAAATDTAPSDDRDRR